VDLEGQHTADLLQILQKSSTPRGEALCALPFFVLINRGDSQSIS
jgi:hypothetical protein